MNTQIPRSLDGDIGGRREAAPPRNRARLVVEAGQDQDAVSLASAPRGASRPHSAEMDAIAAELARLSAPDEAARAVRRDRGPPSPGSFDARAAIRDAVAEIGRRQADLDHRESGTLDDARRPAAAERQADVAPRAVAAEPSVVREAPRKPGPSGQAVSGRGLSSEVSQTFAQFSQDLHAAIMSIDARPTVEALGRQVSDIGRTVQALPNAETMTRMSEQTREMRDILLATTRPAPPAELPGPAVPPQAGMTPPPVFADTMAEVRALLDGFKPGAALAAMESRLENLTERLERGLDAPGPGALIENLGRRVDDLHASLRSRLDETAFDAKPLEGLVRNLSDRLGQVRSVSVDVEQIDATVRDIAAKLDVGGTDPRGVQAVEAQLARLSERLDRSEPSLRALDGVEHSLGELFSQFEVTRQVAIDAAETAARTAARDTLRAALQNPTLAPRGAEAPVLAEQVARGLDELRAKQDLAEQRTQTTLADIRGMIERLALGLPVSVPGARTMQDEPRRRSGEAALQDGARPATDASDLLIEPGLGRGAPVPGRRAEPRLAADVEPETVAGVAPVAEGDGPASFIAAARRAAQAAQASAASAAALTGDERRAQAVPRRRRRAGSEPSLERAAPGTILRARSFLSRQRRPLLLGLAALVLLVGALQVVKLSVEPADNARSGAADSASPVRTRLAASEAPTAPVAAARPAAATVAAVLPPVAAPPLAALPTFVAGATRAPAPADGITEGLHSLADAGNAAAQYEVGLRYAEGRGVARDPRQAVAWFAKAAAQGSAPAEYRLGSAYEKGVGAERDPALAISWYSKAAEAGNIRAMHNLAVMSAEGAAGKPDYVKAAQWFGKASAYGVRDSQFNLAILYARGLGVEQSLPQSYKWFAVAATGGDEDAAKKRDEVAAKLDPAALAAAKASVEAYRPAVAAPAANEVALPPGGWDAAGARPSGAAPGTAAKVSQL